ncbi:MAG: hypothetical protein QOH81_937 [Sphingomonadales bacterium]|jgi:hypothetical protein|nr:hypothetical protein [Sphingomonadales bacterium]
MIVAMKLSRSDKFRFAAEQVGDWARNYGIALSVVGALLILMVALGDYALEGHASAEQGTVVAFGIYADETGDQPLLTIRTNEGQLVQLRVPSSVARTCRAGYRIELLRRQHSLLASPSGCMLGGGT